uniref:Uncharacterized protein n=1 Tax=Mus spicilegus TaxID=10103 RepID=A0A8C6GH51_MUSSI
MSNITLDIYFFFQKHLSSHLQCCPVPFLPVPSLLSRPHASPPQCSVLYACALCSCIINKSEINVFDAEPWTPSASLLSPSPLPLLSDLGCWSKLIENWSGDTQHPTLWFCF